MQDHGKAFFKTKCSFKKIEANHKMQTQYKPDKTSRFEIYIKQDILRAGEKLFKISSETCTIVFGNSRYKFLIQIFQDENLYIIMYKLGSFFLFVIPLYTLWFQ